VRVLVVKTSSLGDVLHTLPALTDAVQRRPGIRFDWVVEEAFAEVPAWHTAVDDVIPVALRRWKHRPLQVLRAGEPQAAVRQLRRHKYDLVIDAQGLLKSAVIARFARGPRAGLDRSSAREPVAAHAYHRKYAVPREQHAVQRVRQLFAAALAARRAARAAAVRRRAGVRAAGYGSRLRYQAALCRPGAAALPGVPARYHLADQALA